MTCVETIKAAFDFYIFTHFPGLSPTLSENATAKVEKYITITKFIWFIFLSLLRHVIPSF